ncbi:DUF6691 family protein [Winogradskyella wichelsiae]|uniref:DUF6691 family protein n=1 Tax=Winogradskyella wichelsiae TaxID=2697007 RepID=UPI0015C83F23|nr:DUF6691 family protein [Winogradskyella wichelsiae]
MSKYIKFFLVGIFFGIVLVKSEAVSWYRIYEMFKFQSFHMFGIIGTAVATGVIILLISKARKVKNTEGTDLKVPLKARGFTRYILGGTIFGLGWALSGACPGPMYILIGTGAFSILVVIIGALIGTYFYGLIMKKLPH